MLDQPLRRRQPVEMESTNRFTCDIARMSLGNGAPAADATDSAGGFPVIDLMQGWLPRYLAVFESPPFPAHYQALLALLFQLDKQQKLQVASLAQSADGQDASVRLKLTSGSIAAQSHSPHAHLLTAIPLHAAASIEFRAGTALSSAHHLCLSLLLQRCDGDSMLGVRCLLAHKHRRGLTQLVTFAPHCLCVCDSKCIEVHRSGRIAWMLLPPLPSIRLPTPFHSSLTLRYPACAVCIRAVRACSWMRLTRHDVGPWRSARRAQHLSSLVSKAHFLVASVSVSARSFFLSSFLSFPLFCCSLV